MLHRCSRGPRSAVSPPATAERHIGRRRPRAQGVRHDACRTIRRRRDEAASGRRYTGQPPGPLAQLVEQGTLNPKVEGSNPSRPIDACPGNTLVSAAGARRTTQAGATDGATRPLWRRYDRTFETQLRRCAGASGAVPEPAREFLLRAPPAPRESPGLAARATHLHVCDLVVSKRQHVPARIADLVHAGAVHRADQLVVASPRKRRVELEAVGTSLPDPVRQDLTGLVGAASGRRVLPPQEAVRHAAPFRVFGEQGRERLGITFVESLDCLPKPVDHRSSTMAGRRASS